MEQSPHHEPYKMSRVETADISDLSKAEVFAALYNEAEPSEAEKADELFQAIGKIAISPETMELALAEAIETAPLHNYLHSAKEILDRPLTSSKDGAGLNLSADGIANFYNYNQLHGDNAAQTAFANYRAERAAKNPTAE